MKTYFKLNLTDKLKFNMISKAYETRATISQLKTRKNNKISSRAKLQVKILR